MSYRTLLILILTSIWLVILIGCEAAPQTGASPASPPPAATHSPDPAARPVAYVNSRAVTDRDLQPLLTEAAGGAVLTELVLDRMIHERLAEQNLALTDDLIAQEKQNMLATLSADPDQAVRLFNEMRARRGLGEKRLSALLYRNAGLRLLVKDRAQAVPALVLQAYQLQYGQRYRVRILVTDTMAEASKLLTRARSGESFSDLASLHSTDQSAAQGGLLSPISPADATYPSAIRKAIETMQPGDISDMIAVDDRFIIIKLEEKLPAEPISFVDVREDLERRVRTESEAQLMQQTARAMLTEAKIVVLDPALAESWRTQQDRLQPE